MTTSKKCLLGLLCTAFVFGCSGSDDGPPPSSDPTFSRVVSEVITEKNCGGPACHSLTVGGFQLGPKDTLYSQLVNQPASGAKCAPLAMDGGGATYIRVVPKKPDESLLYLKINHAPPCGDAMPVSGTLKQDQIDLVHDWIEAGAENN